MKSWKCSSCGESVSEIGAYVKIALNRHQHVSCYAVIIMDAYERQSAQRMKDLIAKQEDDKAAKLEEAQRELLTLRAKGKELWTRADRQRLVEAKLICVHCGIPIGLQAAEAPSGEMRMHCNRCYMAREYGEKAAAQGAAKSAAGIAEVASVLADASKAAPAPPSAQKPEPKAETDRFNLIEME